MLELCIQYISNSITDYILYLSNDNPNPNPNPNPNLDLDKYEKILEKIEHRVLLNEEDKELFKQIPKVKYVEIIDIYNKWIRSYNVR
jgi:hypothetical protein